MVIPTTACLIGTLTIHFRFLAKPARLLPARDSTLVEPRLVVTRLIGVCFYLMTFFYVALCVYVIVISPILRLIDSINVVDFCCEFVL
jgi:hypothetical protein